MAIAMAGIAACLALTAAHPPRAGATFIEVTTAADSLAADGQCSLREAVRAANTNSNAGDGCPAGQSPGLDTVVIHYGTTYPLSIAGSGEDGNLSGDLDLTGGGPIRITPAVNGFGAEADAVIDAGALNPSDRMLDIPDQTGAPDVELVDVVLRNGAVLGDEDGGAIRVGDPDSSLRLAQVRIRDSDAEDYGGAVSFEQASDSSDLEIVESEFSGNSAGDHGGAVYYRKVGSGTKGPTVRQSTFAGNSTSARGGGLYYGVLDDADSGGNIVNSTFSGNSAVGGGGAIGLGFSGLILGLDFVTIAENTTSTAGRAGGIQTDSPDQFVSPSNTILAGNTAAGAPANCARIGAPFVGGSQGHNIESADTCELDPAGQDDLVNTDPLLAPLTFSGGLGSGPTRTRGLYDGSPALDRVPIGACSNSEGVDQRNQARPDPPGGSCDVGAFEGSVGPAPVEPISQPVKKEKKCKKGFRLKKVKKKGKCVKKKKK